MNFTTDLPKKNPLVTYIVASAVKCEKFSGGRSNDQTPSYRMHAVILNQNLLNYDVVFPSEDLLQFQLIKKKPTYQKKPPKSFILCHIRKIDKHYNDAQANSKKRRGSMAKFQKMIKDKIAKKLKFQVKETT
jgi:hypothetical protein